MRFRQERSVLLAAVRKAERATARLQAMPSLANVLLHLDGDSLTISGTNLDIRIDVTDMCAGSKSGAVLVPARLLIDVLRSMDPGGVEVSLDPSGELAVSGGRSRYTILTFDAEEFPAEFHEPSKKPTRLDAQDFVGAVSQVESAASRDGSRPILTAINFAGIGGGQTALCATDSYRLARRVLSGGTVLRKGDSRLVPGIAVRALKRLCVKSHSEIEVGFSASSVMFDLGDTRISARLLDGTFPNVESLWPETFTGSVRVDRTTLLTSSQAAKVMAQESAPIRFEPNDATLLLVGKTHDVGTSTETIDAAITGNPPAFALNPSFFIDCLKAFDTDEIDIKAVDSLKPVIVESPGEGDRFRQLLMPVRVP